MQVNNYYHYQSALSKEQCQYIIDAGLKEISNKKKEGQSTAAITFGKNHKQGNLDLDARPLGEITYEQLSKEQNKTKSELVNSTYIRDSEVAWLTEQKIYDMILPFVHSSNFNAGWKYDLESFEQMQFTVYKPNGFYGWHLDGPNDHLSVYKRYIDGLSPPLEKNGEVPQGYTKNSNHVGLVRKISITINLNEPGDYEGGNLKFDFGPHTDKERFHECTEIRPQGSLIAFPSFLYHQVTPVVKGTRYSLVLWSLGRPFR